MKKLTFMILLVLNTMVYAQVTTVPAIIQQDYFKRERTIVKTMVLWGNCVKGNISKLC